jgi:hypothetical protein
MFREKKNSFVHMDRSGVRRPMNIFVRGGACLRGRSLAPNLPLPRGTILDYYASGQISTPFVSLGSTLNIIQVRFGASGSMLKPDGTLAATNAMMNYFDIATREILID